MWGSKSGWERDKGVWVVTVLGKTGDISEVIAGNSNGCLLKA